MAMRGREKKRRNERNWKKRRIESDEREMQEWEKSPQVYRRGPVYSFVLIFHVVSLLS